MTSRHVKAVFRAEELVDKAEHNLLVVIALQRARNGNANRFPFKFRNKVREVWLVARIEDNTAMRGGHTLVIDYSYSEANYFATPLPHADALKDGLTS